jgi:hypothetical protein
MIHLSQRAWLVGLTLFLLPLPAIRAAEESARLREQFLPGYQYHVSSRVELSGTLSLPLEKGQTTPKTLAVTGTSAIEYDERVLAAGSDGQVQKTVRLYRRMDFQRQVGGQTQENTVRPAVRRMVLLADKQVKAPFSPDGPLTWGEIDLVRTDVFTPALVGLLPDHEVRLNDHWPAATSAVQELTAMEHLDSGQVECRLEQITTLEGRPYARVALTGTIQGMNEDGPNRQQLDGYFFFDLGSQHLSYLSLKGVQTLLDKDGKEQGRVEGQFVLTRQLERSRDLSDEALKGVILEPNPENTLLLYDNPDLGIRLLYPRRWHVAGVHGRQVALDESEGSGLLLTLEPLSRLPTGAQYLAESRAYLGDQKAKVLRVDGPQSLQGPPKELAHFALDAEVAGQRVLMDYYVIRQASGGAALTARLLPADLANRQKEVEAIARSVQVTRTIGGKTP